MSKKIGIVAVLCLAVFSGFVAPLAGQLNVKSQSALYKQSTTHIAWQVCSHCNSIRKSILKPTELSSISGIRHWWLLLCPRLLQAWSKLSHILDTDRLSPHASMGSSHDPQNSVQQLHRLPILLWILWRRHWSSWATSFG
jgi:hypothetical protein